MDLKIPEKKEKKTKTKKKHSLSLPTAVEDMFFKAKMYEQMASALLSQVKTEASKAVFAELDNLDEGRVIPDSFEFGDVQFVTSAPRVPSAEKETTMGEIGIDTDKAFPVQATNPMLTWELVKRANIAPLAEKLLKLIDRATNPNNEEDKVILEAVADAISDSIEWEGNCIQLDKPRKPAHERTAWLKLIHSLPPVERDQFINNIGLSASLKADKASIESHINKITSANQNNTNHV